jgi:hypothetical protein
MKIFFLIDELDANGENLAFKAYELHVRRGVFADMSASFHCIVAQVELGA